MTTVTNYFTEAGAKKLAKCIERYWREQGYAGIKTHIIDLITDEATREHGDRHTIYCVRSNIGPLGYPPRTIEKEQAA